MPLDERGRSRKETYENENDSFQNAELPLLTAVRATTSPFISTSHSQPEPEWSSLLSAPPFERTLVGNEPAIDLLGESRLLAPPGDCKSFPYIAAVELDVVSAWFELPSRDEYPPPDRSHDAGFAPGRFASVIVSPSARPSLIVRCSLRKMRQLDSSPSVPSRRSPSPSSASSEDGQLGSLERREDDVVVPSTGKGSWRGVAAPPEAR